MPGTLNNASPPPATPPLEDDGGEWITARELIRRTMVDHDATVHASLRKIANDKDARDIRYPDYEPAKVDVACQALLDGHFFMIVDGAAVDSPDQRVHLTGRTETFFIPARPIVGVK